MRTTLVTVALAAILVTPATAVAQASSPHTLTGNVGLYSQYIFRGLTQTNKDPALQGGFDYSHASGLYVGTWGSNISWLTDSPTVTGYSSSSLELDFYGGYRGSAGDFGYDAGLLYYYYPGTHSTALAAGTFKANTTEIYGALSWKFLSAKLSVGVGDETFGVPSSDGTYYLDLGVNYPISDKLTLNAHYGIQEFKGSTGGVSNDSFASYKDWKLGVSYALPDSFTVGAYYTDTDMNTAQTTFYTNSLNRFVGKETFTVFVQKTF